MNKDFEFFYNQNLFEVLAFPVFYNFILINFGIQYYQFFVGNINFIAFIIFLNCEVFIKFTYKAIDKKIFSILEALMINIFSFISSLIHNPLFVITARYFPSDVYGDFNSK